MHIDEDVIRQLQETLAHQGRVIDELNGELAKLWLVHEAEKRRLNALITRLSELEDAASPGHEITRPPHY